MGLLQGWWFSKGWIFTKGWGDISEGSSARLGLGSPVKVPKGWVGFVHDGGSPRVGGSPLLGFTKDWGSSVEEIHQNLGAHQDLEFPKIWGLTTGWGGSINEGVHQGLGFFQGFGVHLRRGPTRIWGSTTSWGAPTKGIEQNLGAHQRQEPSSTKRHECSSTKIWGPIKTHFSPNPCGHPTSHCKQVLGEPLLHPGQG